MSGVHVLQAVHSVTQRVEQVEDDDKKQRVGLTMVSINTLVGQRVGLTMVSINTLVGQRVGLTMVSINTLVGQRVGLTMVSINTRNRG